MASREGEKKKGKRGACRLMAQALMMASTTLFTSKATEKERDGTS